MVQSLLLLLFYSYNKCYTREIFFVLIKSYSISPVHLQHILEKTLFHHIF